MKKHSQTVISFSYFSLFFSFDFSLISLFSSLFSSSFSFFLFIGFMNISHFVFITSQTYVIHRRHSYTSSNHTSVDETDRNSSHSYEMFSPIPLSLICTELDERSEWKGLSLIPLSPSLSLSLTHTHTHISKSETETRENSFEIEKRKSKNRKRERERDDSTYFTMGLVSLFLILVNSTSEFEWNRSTISIFGINASFDSF